jgi:hypothetical protein
MLDVVDGFVRWPWEIMTHRTAEFRRLSELGGLGDGFRGLDLRGWLRAVRGVPAVIVDAWAGRCC